MANEIKRKYVTVAFLALNIAAYLLSTVFGEKVYESGSLSVLDVLENHEYYRLFFTSRLSTEIRRWTSSQNGWRFSFQSVKSIGKSQHFDPG